MCNMLLISNHFYSPSLSVLVWRATHRKKPSLDGMPCTVAPISIAMIADVTERIRKICTIGIACANLL